MKRSEFLATLTIPFVVPFTTTSQPCAQVSNLKPNQLFLFDLALLPKGVTSDHLTEIFKKTQVIEI